MDGCLVLQGCGDVQVEQEGDGGAYLAALPVVAAVIPGIDDVAVVLESLQHTCRCRVLDSDGDALADEATVQVTDCGLDGHSCTF